MNLQRGSLGHLRIRTSPAIAALAVVALTATACGGSASTETDSGGDGSFEPNRPVTFVVATGAGGGGDIFGRAAAAGISEVRPDVRIGVENHTGGNEVVGATFALSHADDPHYMFVANTSLVLIPFAIDPPPDYTWESFTPVAMLAADQQLLIVPADSPYQSLEDLVEGAGGEELRVGLTSATGTDSAVATMLEDAEGISFQHVILEAGADSVTSLLAGDIELSFLNPSEVKGQLESGDLRALAVFGEERYDEGSGLEDIPTAQEQGIDLTFQQFRGLMAPGELSDAELEYWVSAAEEWTEEDSYTEYIESNALQPAWASGQEFIDFIEGQQAQFEQVFGG